ncbi:MAG: hypothetical protein JO332_15835 [Planctomycetaceae bacterium]|nr:hypothetical protein [Planctomycetaceae bacterium]
MKYLRRLGPLLILPCLAGCIFGGGASSRIEKVPEDLRQPRVVVPKAPDRHAYGDVSKLRPGVWATYREGARLLTLAAVAVEGDSVWIEVIDEGEPRQVSARLVGPDGIVRKAYYGEISRDGRRSSVEPQPLEQADIVPPSRLAETGRETGEESVVVSGKELRARRVSLRFEDLEGRLIQDVSLWHKDVPPLYAGGDDGGLVRRKAGTSVVELVDFGQDARPLLALPH